VVFVYIAHDCSVAASGVTDGGGECPPGSPDEDPLLEMGPFNSASFAF